MDPITRNSCPVCGYDLGFPPWVGPSASHESCPSCGIEFGYHDWTEGDATRRPGLYIEWRKHWIADGMKWHGGNEKPPANWNPVLQLSTIGIKM